MVLLVLRGQPQPFKKLSQIQKGHFYEKMYAINDTKTLELAKSAKVTRNICGICQGLAKVETNFIRQNLTYKNNPGLLQSKQAFFIKKVTRSLKL